MNQKIAVGVVYVAALFMAIMDTTIVNVALPVMGRDFHTNPDAVDAVVIGFLVSTGVFLTASGWLGDRFGGRKVLLFAVVLFTGASALCGLASSLGELVVFRVLQGAAGGLMTPVGMAMLFRVFPPAERVRASSILMIPTALAPALGPVLGGLLVTDLSWRWVFYVNVPIGVAATVFGALFLDDHIQAHPGRFDLAGFLLAASGLGLVMYGVSEGPLKGWGSTDVLVTLVAGAAVLVAMVLFELRRATPLVDLRLYRDRLFRATSLVLTLGAVAFLGVLFMVALFYQDGLHLTALQSGLNTFPEALGVLIGAQIVSRRLYPVFGPRRIMASGLTLVALSMAGLSAVGAGTSLWWARLLMLLIGLGMSCVFIPAQAASFATISPEQTGRASTLFNAARQLGGAVGVAFLTTVLAAAGPTVVKVGHVVPNLGAYHAAFLAAAGVALVAVLTALTVSDGDAAATMVRRGRLARRDRVRAAAAPEPVVAVEVA
ncbi:MAG: DHA2 family efflux MFS transporter permease subunit [Acidimicrobiales bacterium]